jgi:hypothetical protein
MAEVISPPEIAGIICVEPFCTTVAVMMEGPKSGGVGELAVLVCLEVVAEELLLVVSPLPVDEVDDAEALDELNNELLVEFWPPIEEVDDGEALDELETELDECAVDADEEPDEDEATFADVLSVD